VEAIFDVEASRTLTDEQKRRVTARHGPRVTATAQDTRSQARNRELAMDRLQARVNAALVTQRRRKPSKPTKASRERRLESKRRQAQRKRDRRAPED
jgi:ribosome-associated protein